MITFDDMIRQANKTAGEYLDAAIREIDAALGMGYAAKHPELIAAFMQTAAADYDTMTRYRMHQEEQERAAAALEEFGEGIEN